MKRNFLKKILAPWGVVLLSAALWAGDTAIVDGQNAEDVVGQTDAGGNAVFTDGSPYDSQRLEGFNIPYDVEVDTVSHRLFVCDYSSSRILVYDLDSSNVLVDRTADRVLGQSGFYRNLSGTNASGLNFPTGIDFHAGSNRLYVGDQANHRVVIFDVASITDGENAVNVLGQGNFTSGSAATTLSGMRNPNDCVYDGVNKRLFVSDTYNYRILVFDLSTVTDGENAVNVLGQDNFTTNSSTASIKGFNTPRHVDYDPTNSRLFVADYNNNRVLVFDVSTVADGENAVNVLGQSDFSSSGSAKAINRFTNPFGVVYATATQRLYVGDSWSQRVTIFDVASITDGENAVNVLGQSDFTSSTNRTTQDGMYIPRGLTIDEGASRVFVTDQYNNRVMMFDVSTTTIVNGQNAQNVVGQTDGAGTGVYTTDSTYDGMVQKGIDRTYDVVVDTVSHRLFVADHNSHRVLVYNLNAGNILEDRTADNVLGQPDFLNAYEMSATQSSVVNPSGLSFDSSRGYLFVTSYFRSRVLIFDVNSITNGENAINVLGQSNFTAGGYVTSQAGLRYPYGLDYDGGTQRLFVSDRNNHRVMVYDLATITNGENAVNVLGQSDFTTNTLVTPPTAASLNYPHDVEVVGNQLYVADEYNNRVTVFDVLSITDGENAINVLGQTNFTSNGSGASQSALNHPKSFAKDTQLNRLFVSDYNNHRVLVFDVAAITDGENAANVLGQLNFTGNSAATSQSRMYSPTGLSYDSGMNRLYVAEYLNHRVLIHSVGPVAPSSSTLTASTGVGAGKIDVSWASAGDDGAFNNLTGYYRIQYATYTATWSTSTTPTNAYTSTITATNVSPGVVQSTTIVVSPTTPQTWYFVLWTADEVGNWSTISSTTTASPPYVIADYGVGPFDVTSVGGGLSQGGTAWGDFDNDGDLDVVVSGTDGTNNQVRVYKSNGNGTFNSTAVNVAAANSGLKDGDVAWADFDNDGDLDVLVSGTDNTNQQLRVYRNNGNSTFNTNAVEVAGSNNGLKQGGVAWGDYDNDGDLDVLAGGYDGTNNQLRAYKNNGNATFDATAINVAGSNNGLRAGGVAWGDYDNDADLDVLISGTDGTNRQLRVYANNGNGTFNATATNVAGSNNGLSDGRVAWGDFDKDGDLEVLVSGTDGTNHQLRTYSNNGNGTFNSTTNNVAGSSGGVINSAVAVGDFNVDGNIDILAAGRPKGLVGYWKFDENTGTSAADLSGNGYTGTLTNGPTWTTGKYGKALNYNGVNQYVNMGNVLDFSTDDITFGAWINPANINQTKMFIGKRQSSGPYKQYQLMVGSPESTGNVTDSKKIAVVFYAGDAFSNSQCYRTVNDVIDGNWHFVLATRRGATVQIYVDGVIAALTTVVAGPVANVSNPADFNVGFNNSASYFDGKIDEARVYNRVLSAGEIAALYQTTKASVGTLRIHKGVGDGTFNATPVEVDNGLEKGQVAWGDADGDGDLDILTSGSDGTNSQLSVYLSTQSLTASNTTPTAPGTLAGTMGFNTSGVSVASFTWTAGSDSGTGSTSENGLTYDLQISTTSNFGVLMFPGQMGATPRMGSYLKPPKIFNGNTYYGVVMKSTDPWNAQTTASYGLRTDTTYYYRVKTVDSALAESGWSSNGSAYTGVGPSTSTLAAASTATDGEVLLTWNSAGDDGMNGNVTGTYRIQYATYTPSWSTSSTPTNATTVSISTTNVVPGSAQSKLITGLTGGLTYYFVLWTGDEVPNWSTVSNTTSAVPMADITAPSTSTLAATSGNPEEVTLTWTSAGDDGGSGNLTGNYRIQYATYVVTWSTSSTPTDATTVTIATATQTPGSAQSRTITSLLSGVTYYFVLWSQDESNNWSGISNTTSTLGGYWFDPNQIEVDGAGGGLTSGGVAWGDYDNDGDLDVLASGSTIGSTRELRIYKNNGNGTIDAAEIDVAGAGAALSTSSLAWGDHDNDGDLDILVGGDRTTYSQLRIYKNNGNGTMDSVPIDVGGLNMGLSLGGVAWGDFDNDGDLDVLSSGQDFSNDQQLRIYKNNGNGTLDTNEIDLDGDGGGLIQGKVVWGDYDSDGDLDVLSIGLQGGSTRKLQIHNNNGNGTMDASQIEVDGSGGGLSNYSSAAWGDYDSDGDLDILAMGDGSSSAKQLRIYKNNGNGTLDAAQIEVDGSGGGLRAGSVAWGDLDSDGDLDVLACGTDGANRQLRVYKNNGNGTMDATQIELDGAGGGLSSSWAAWGDYDTDGDLDVLTNGTTATTRELRIYKNLSAVPNTAPTSPGSLTASWAYSALGSTATFKWNAGSDNGSSPTPANGLTYQVEISSDSGFTGKSVVPGQWATPGMGNYLKPPLIFDGNTNHGVMLRYLPTTNTTYYYRVKTIDAGLKESAWSATGSLYTAVASSVPSVVTDLVASSVTTSGQIFLTWTEPVNINSGGSAAYDVRYRTSGAITSDGEFDGATAATGEPTPGSPGTGQSMGISGLVPGTTYYFAIKSSNVNGTSALDTSSPRPSAVANEFDATEIDVDGAWGGLDMGEVTWGDYDNDGDLDVLVSGANSGGTRQLRIYKNNGNGTMDAAQIEVDGGGGGLYTGSSVKWGDYDNDGDLDVLAGGSDGTPQLRVYKNNGNGTIDAAQIEVDGLNGGVREGGVAWGDFDNDGDLDILASGEGAGSALQLRIYKNNGNGTLDPAQIEVESAGGGLEEGEVAWGDYDNDGDLDVSASGTTAGATRELRIYKNNGNGTMDPAQIEVESAGGGMRFGSMAWSDYDNDGDLDLLANGRTIAPTREIRIYKNNGNGTMDATQIEVDSAGLGLDDGTVAWGDHDNDGDLDVLVNGYTGISTCELRVYKNNGNGTMNATQIEVNGAEGGLYQGSVAWGDYDNDGDLDVLVSGEDGGTAQQLRIYKNFNNLAQANTAPTSPGTLAGAFTYDASGVSIASFTWNTGTDSGTGMTVENGLTYDLQISTTSNFSKLMFPGQMGASPRMGSYLKPPKIFNSNTYYGVLLKSTDPWNAQTTASYGLRTDTTYYYRVKTVDSALAESAWSGSGTVNTGVGPSTSTLAGAATANSGEVALTWSSAGDDGMIGNLTGTYRIQYATYTASWSTSTTPTNATTVTIATTTQTPASAQAKLVTGLTGGLTYYFVLWTADEVPNWSTISNTTSAVPVADLVVPSTSTLAATSGNPEEVTLTWNSAGDDGGSGNFTGNFRIQYATYTVTWSTSSTPTNATTVTIATTTQVPGSAQSRTITSLLSGVTYYFVLWSQDESNNWSGISNTTSAVGGYWFDPNQIDVDGPGGGLAYSDVAWGDYDNDGDMDVLTNGYTGTTRELRIYKNNGNGTMDAAQIEVDGAGGGLSSGGVAWGDYDNDGDLDVLLSGYTGATRELRIYKNNGNGTMDAAQIEVASAGGGLDSSDLAWGDYDNDGDLDVLVSGYRGTYELRVYKNNGNGTMDATQIDVDGPNGGLSSSSVAWGDFDNDGDIDVLTMGGGAGYALRVYKNNGNGTLDPTQIILTGRSAGGVAWGDYDTDGDLDILVNGTTAAKYLNIYNNNGNATFNATGVVVDSADGGLSENGVAWGDHDNDGDLDVLVGGVDASAGRQLRVYKNNGNGTIDAAQVEVDGVGGGFINGKLAWGDYDNDGDLDVLASGQQTSGDTRELRIYKNQSPTANTAPTSPGTLVSSWDYTASGISTATFKWAPGADSGTGATPANVLTYQVEISTMSNFTGKSVVPGQWATPGMGNYLKPPQIYDGNTNHGVGLRYLPFTNTTYYYRVKTIDAGLKESAWSATGSLYTLVASSVPSVVTDLVASSVTTNGQILLTWTAPLNINSGGSAAYDVRYRTSGAITTDGEFDGATAATGEPTPGTPGAGQTMEVTGLVPGATYYFAIKSSNVNGTSGLDVSSPRPSAMARDFDTTQIEVDGAGGGLYQGDVVWGDYDNDGDLDVLVSGLDGASARQLRIYKNNGNSTMDSAEVDVDVAASGLYEGGLAWGDYDNDGDLDVLANGRSAQELRIYKNNGNGTMDAAQIEVDASGGGLRLGDVTWGDFDNDGDLDILTGGYTGTTRELRIYKNNGNGTIDATQIEVDGANGGLTESEVAWGDYDNDGDLDVLASGYSGSGRELRIYKNNGNGTLDATQTEVDSAGGGVHEGDVAWGDFDNDGDLDILVVGYTGSTRELRIYKNNGNGTMDATQIEVDGAGGGLQYSSVAWGDNDNDGDLDVLTSGYTGSTRELRVYKNNGNGTLNSTQIEVDGSGGGLRYGGVAWGDYDSDGDLDVLANGDDWAALRQLRIYKSYISLAQTNTTPSAPGTLSSSFSFNIGSVSVASFTWAAGTDSGAGATVENGLTYDLQISTTSNFSKLMFPGQMGASPRMGSYLKPPKIFNSNTYYGIVLKSTDPWNAQTAASYGLRTDTTYYYRVKTVDSALAESAWSGSGTVNTGVGPATSTITSTAGVGEVTLNWSSAGDDGMIGNLTGTYRIQYATYTASWSTSTTPTNATTVTIATTTQTPASAQSNLVTGLTGGLTYYFVLWTADEVPNWSTISNTTSAVPVADLVVPSTSTLAATSGNPEEMTLTWNSAGDDGGSGNFTGNFRIQYATYTVTWSTSSTPTNATTVTIATTTQVPGSAQSRTITSLLSGVTYYFVLWSQDESNNWSGISNTTSAVGGYWFDPNQIEVDGLNGGTSYGGVGWGDYDADGDVDILVSGNAVVRVYKNNGNGTFDATQITVSAVGFIEGDVSWGDYDNDGDLDVLGIGDTGGPEDLYIYKNNGNGTFNSTAVDADPEDGGLYRGTVEWGDFDNDGDLDILATGASSLNQLRVYKNNGNGTIDSAQIEVDGNGGGASYSSGAWGDFENDGDLDILFSGDSGILRVYKNNGNGSFNPTQIEVDGATGGLGYGRAVWGNFDNDGDLDILAIGYYGGSVQLRIYNNNGNGTIDASQIEVDGVNNGLYYAAAAWGDFDGDGDLDILASGVRSSAQQLRVYKNNGNATMDATQIEVDGLNGGLEGGEVAWGDYDNDGDLDILANGTNGNRQLRVYKNLNPLANTAPSAPSTLTSTWAYNASGTSTATFKWNPGADNGSPATPANVLTYQMEISTMSDFTGKSIVAGQWSTPGMGNYLKPPQIYDGNSNQGVGLRYLPFTNTTYYYRVKTIDAGLKESAWSATGSLYTLVASSVPSVVTDLVASSVTTNGQILLTWTAPLNINSGGSAAYDVRYRTSGAITTDGEFDGATAATGEPTPGTPGAGQTMGVTGLVPGATYYFAIKSSNVNGTSGLDVSSPRPSVMANSFDATEIDVDGAGGGLSSGDVAWGDYDNDGDLDILTSGYATSTRELRIYKNNGNGTMDPAQIEVDVASGAGLQYSAVVWGDYDNDGDLDVLTSGEASGSTRQLRVYKNNGNGTMDPAQIEVDTAGGGLQSGGVAWGDYDNDGDLDVLASGGTASTRELRIYKNNGNGTIDASQIEVDGEGGGLSGGGVAWGDYDGDGDLDVLASGGQTSGSTKELRIYKNNGNGTMDATQIELDTAGGGVWYGGVAWGDYDSDGDLDVLVSGTDGSSSRQLRIYKNNGNGTMDAAQIEVDGAGGGLENSRVSWGDFDNDGDLDVMTSGATNGGTRELRVYKNNGNGTLNSIQIEVDGAGWGVRYGGVALGDFDSDGDLDVLANGEDSATAVQLRIYKSYINLAQTNTTPSAPGTLSGSFSLNAGSVSVASFTWAAGTDSGAGATVENGLTYDLQISTTSNFSKLMFPGQMGASPRMGSYLKPPKIFNSNTDYGVVLKSTDPWNAQTTASYGLRTDTTYYYRVKTVDSALAESAWSGSGTVNTGVGPATSTITSTAGVGEVTLNWSSAGDDGMIGNLTGTYRIQYATYTASWSTSTTPTNATTVTIATTTQTPASAQSNLVTGLTGGLTYYFVLWTADEVPHWSTISNTTSAVPVADLVAPSTSTLAATSGNPEEVLLTWTSAGDNGSTGNLTGNYRIQYATYSATWATGSTPTNATTVTIATTTQTPGSAQSRAITGLLSGTTYYFAIYTQDDSSNWSGVSNTTSAVGGYWFDPNQINVDGSGGGLDYSGVAWGDYDNDGDLDVLTNGYTGTTRELRIYKNNGNGTMDAGQIDVDGAGGGLSSGGVAWGDYDNDGDLDVLAGGGRGTQELRVYKNNGNGTMDANQIDVDGANGGLTDNDVAWGDFDNDGDLDVLANGTRGTFELRVYKNNGNGTLDTTQIDVDGPNGGMSVGSVAWGDFDNDGDIDILAMGGGASYRFGVYKNNGNGTFNPIEIELSGSSRGGVVWGDYDNDGDLDILVNGSRPGFVYLDIFTNNGNGTINATAIVVDSADGGLKFNGVAWGDHDNDGDLDILVGGEDASSGRQLRVYKNNGNGTIDAAQMELDGVGGGLINGDLAWGDFDNDGDLDTLTSGQQTSGNTRELRIYKNQSATANTAPSAPSTLTSTWAYNATGTSTATFKWNPGADNGSPATPAHVLTYQMEISTMSNFTGKSVVPGQWATPGMGNYLKPPKIYDGNTNHGVGLRYLPFTNTTYYYRVKTIDAGLKESAWSATGSLYTLVASSVPSVVTDLVASSVTTNGQILLTWTAPLNINSGGSAAYDVRYRTSGAITTDGEFNGATAATGEPTPVSPGVGQTMGVTGLVPGATYYFAIKSSNVNGTSGLDVSSPRPSVMANSFDATEIDVDGAGGGLSLGDVAWGDYDNDGNLDVLTSGYTIGGTRELRIYKNNGNGTMDATQIEVEGVGGGLRYSGLAWGDHDNDGDLDVLASGEQTSGTTRELRIYKNNGNGTMDAAQIEVDGAGGGLSSGGVAWGDYDNDGDLDVLASGQQTSGSTRELRIYKNNGNGTIDATQIEVDGANGGLTESKVAWGDFENDGDLDVLVSGYTGSSRELRIYKNNGNGSMDAAQIEVDGAGGGLEAGCVAWGDYDKDGDMDVLRSGWTGSYARLSIYKNNGNGSMDATQIDLGGLRYSSVAWGDYDNDGDLDVLASGNTYESTIELRVYKNNGNGTINAAQIEMDGANGGLNLGSAVWGDYDSDGDLDVLANGEDGAAAKQLRIYKNYINLAQTNTTPSAPGTLSSSFSFNIGSVSVASFTWAAGTDSGAGATVENGLTYDLQISTTSNFSKLMFPGQMGASPRMGSYLKPPKIFNSNTYYGIVLKSTDPWNAQTTASYGLRTDTTYYYRVKTVDSALAESGWSTNGSAYTGVVPSTSTLAAASTATDGEVLLTWDSPGDDAMNGNLTGTYRIQYATFTASWSTGSTPTDATTVTIATTTQVPGSSQSKLITGLTGGLTYYFVLWTGDEVPNWSTISNSTSAVPFVSIRSVTIEGLNTLGFGVVNLGSQVVSSTGVVIRNNGTLVNKYVLSASTQTVGSPWSVKDSTPAGPDAMVIFGLFDDDTAPVLGNFGVEDLIGTIETGSNSSVFSIDGSTTGASVPAGETRKIWIRLDMPTTSRTESPQTMRIQITAQPP